MVNVFRQYQRSGQIPTGYDHPHELQDAMQSLVKNGMTIKDAMAELGVTANIFNKNGSIDGRGIRNSHSPEFLQAIDMVSGDGSAAAMAANERKTWSAAQAENRDVGLTIGMKTNHGHVDTSAGGAPQAGRAAGTESAVINQINGRSPENPSRPFSQNEKDNLGVANTKVKGLFESKLQMEGMPARSGTEGILNPYVSQLVGSDHTTRYVGPGLESLNRTFSDLAAQDYNEVAMYDHLVAGGKADPKSLAKAGSQHYGVSTFARPDPNNTAPVTVVRPANPKPPTVVAAKPIQLPPVVAAAGQLATTKYGVPASVASPKPQPAPVNPASKPLQGGVLNAIPDFVSAAQKGDVGGMLTAVVGGAVEGALSRSIPGQIINQTFFRGQPTADGTLEAARQRGDLAPTIRPPKQQDLKPEQWSSYKAGGGDAKLRQGLTIQQVIELGRTNKR
jgi:hypothetical protein